MQKCGAGQLVREDRHVAGDPVGNDEVGDAVAIDVGGGDRSRHAVSAESLAGGKRCVAGACVHGERVGKTVSRDQIELPSPFRSAAASPTGKAPLPTADIGAKVPSPRPISSVTASPFSSATAISRIASASRGRPPGASVKDRPQCDRAP